MPFEKKKCYVFFSVQVKSKNLNWVLPLKPKHGDNCYVYVICVFKSHNNYLNFVSFIASFCVKTLGIEHLLSFYLVDAKTSEFIVFPVVYFL